MTTTTLQKRTSIATTVAVALMLFVAVYVATRQAPARQPAPPEGFTHLGQADLSAQAHDETTLAQFSLAQTGDVSLFFTLEKLNAPLFDLSIEGADGARFSVMHSEALRTDRAGSGEWQETLPPGDYRLVLSAAQGAGALTVYAIIP